MVYNLDGVGVLMRCALVRGCNLPLRGSEANSSKVERSVQRRKPRHGKCK